SPYPSPLLMFSSWSGAGWRSASRPPPPPPSPPRPNRRPPPPQFIEGLVAAYARNAVETYEREGPSALDSFLQHVEREANVRSRLFDADGHELAGREATADESELAARVSKSGEAASKMLGGKTLDARAV